MIWFRSYAENSEKGPQKEMAQLSPWFGQALSYIGTNIVSPVRSDVRRSERDAEAMTPEQVNRRTADMLREKKSQWTGEELKEAQDKRHDYHRRIANPVRRFKAKAKRRGMSTADINSKVRAFQKAEKKSIETGEESTNEKNILTFT
jgi:hypothetical protein